MSLCDELLASSGVSSRQKSWINLLMAEGKLLASLADADVVFWLRDGQGKWRTLSHNRPGGVFTLFHRDFLGKAAPEELVDLLNEAFSLGRIIERFQDGDAGMIKLRAAPVGIRGVKGTRQAAPIVITVHSLTDKENMVQQIYSEYRVCTRELLEMICRGDFPPLNSASSWSVGSAWPAEADGLIRIDREGNVLYAAPKTLSIFQNLGFVGEIEGKNLSEVVAGLVEDAEVTVDESLPLVVTGRYDWQVEIVVRGITVAFRSIPLRVGGDRRGAIVLCKDISERRTQEMQLMTRDATIREIHHRVKNNLQTVASLLRLQARRSESEVLRRDLEDAMRRVSAIALVHDALSGSLDQDAKFDEVFSRVMKLVVELSKFRNSEIELQVHGCFGILPVRYASPMALVMAELVSNAVEHGLSGLAGQIITSVHANEGMLYILVSDSGVGMIEEGSGLGTSIVKTLVCSELGGRISWHKNPFTPPPGSVECDEKCLPTCGTTVMLQIPLNHR